MKIKSVYFPEYFASLVIFRIINNSYKKNMFVIGFSYKLVVMDDSHTN